MRSRTAFSRLWLVSILAAAAVGCGGTAAAAADAAAGEKVFKKCATCHSLEVGKNKVGPSLAGVVGRPAATIEGFKYSDAMKASGIVWTEDKLDAYLASPKEVVPGGKMTFAGLKKEDDRLNVIEYLKQPAP